MRPEGTEERMEFLYPALGMYAFALPLLGVALPDAAAPVVWALVVAMPVIAAAYVHDGAGPLGIALRSLGTALVAAALFAGYVLLWRLPAAPGWLTLGVQLAAPALAVLVLAGLGLRAIARDPGHRVALTWCWFALVAEVIAVGPVVGRLSEARGNAGMDLAGMLLAPVLAFCVWAGVAGVRGIARLARP